MTAVAALFVRQDSCYKQMPGVDCYDIERDARKWPGGCPVVAHPPCKRWSMVNYVVLARYPHKAAEFAWGNDGGTFEFALSCVRQWGGVLEHPAQSRAFAHYHLPPINRGPDAYGGWSCEVRQVDWGHRAEKRTWLYIVGAGPDDLPTMPASGAAPSARVSRMRSCGHHVPLSDAEAEATPPAFAAWLVDLASRCRVNERVAT